MRKHTPGPWTVTNLGRAANAGGVVFVINNDEQEQHVAQTTSGYDDISEANAHLIAAAPELLEVMERALKLSQEHPDFRLYAMEPFLRAIAKARGSK